MKKYIEFKKQRELGDVLTDAFGFVKIEFKPFLKTIFQISGPYLVLFLLSMAFYMYSVGDIFSFTAAGNFDGGNTTSLFVMFFAIMCFAVFGVLAYTFATSAALHYIESYSNNNGEVDFSAVKQNTHKTFWSFLGLNLLKWIVLFFSILLCVLPVFYFMVPMAVVLSILVFEKKDIGDSFSTSFKLIKEEFWITLATIIIVGLIVMVASYAFSLPAAMYSMVKMGIFSGEIDPTNMQSFIDPIYILLNILNYLVQFLLNLISIVAAALIYFNLNERKNFTGTFERIQSIGKRDD